jgi:hypothetical protein
MIIVGLKKIWNLLIPIVNSAHYSIPEKKESYIRLDGGDVGLDTTDCRDLII